MKPFEVAVAFFLLMPIFVILFTYFEAGSIQDAIQISPIVYWDSVSQAPLIFHAETEILDTVISIENAIDNVNDLGLTHLWFISFSYRDEWCQRSSMIFDVLDTSILFEGYDTFKSDRISSSCTTCLDVCAIRGIPNGWVDTLHIFHVDSYCECVNDLIHLLQNPSPSHIPASSALFMPNTLLSSTPIPVKPNNSSSSHLENLRVHVVKGLKLLPSVIRNSLLHTKPKVLTTPNLPLNGILMHCRAPFPKMILDWETFDSSERIVPDVSYSSLHALRRIQSTVSLSDWKSNESLLNRRSEALVSENFADLVSDESSPELERRTLLNNTILYDIPFFSFEASPLPLQSPEEIKSRTQNQLAYIQTSATIASHTNFAPNLDRMLGGGLIPSIVSSFANGSWWFAFRKLWNGAFRENANFEMLTFNDVLHNESKRHLNIKEMKKRETLERVKKLGLDKESRNDHDVSHFEDVLSHDKNIIVDWSLFNNSPSNSSYTTSNKSFFDSKRPLVIGVHLECCALLFFRKEERNKFEEVMNAQGCTPEHSHAHALSPAPQPLVQSLFFEALEEVCPRTVSFVYRLRNFVNETWGSEKVRVVMLPNDLPQHLKSSRASRIMQEGLWKVITEELSSVDVAFSMESHMKPRIGWWSTHLALGVISLPMPGGEFGIEDRAKSWLRNLIGSTSDPLSKIAKMKSRVADMGKNKMLAMYFVEVYHYLAKTNSILKPGGTRNLGKKKK
eukprot:GDKJ01050038.1.p1 GENE.GDKJ01050038.1~~GDKJ01050038.1.p1  ORF type:complete len:733 (+),score=116.70 GDKJ01050038.1:53-2251(+)